MEQLVETKPRGLFIGRPYFDVVVIAERWPEGDEKMVAHDYEAGIGGNAVTAALCCAKLGLPPELMVTVANDDIGDLFGRKFRKYGVHYHSRLIQKSAFSMIRPANGKRSMLRARDDVLLEDFPHLHVSRYAALHLDGHQPDAALFYAERFREHGILTSLDGGTRRDNTDELLKYIDVAVVSEDFCRQYEMTIIQMLMLLRTKGCRIGAVTCGAKGMTWYVGSSEDLHMPALHIHESAVIDTNGAGDVFHGAYMYSYLSLPQMPWEYHFTFARAASTHAIQHLGNEASLPSLQDVERVTRTRHGQVHRVS